MNLHEPRRKLYEFCLSHRLRIILFENSKSEHLNIGYRNFGIANLFVLTILFAHETAKLPFSYMQHIATHRNMVAKRAQHVASNNSTRYGVYHLLIIT